MLAKSIKSDWTACICNITNNGIEKIKINNINLLIRTILYNITALRDLSAIDRKIVEKNLCYLDETLNDLFFNLGEVIDCVRSENLRIESKF